jgi:TRAP-type C4-dicarboxylate transport system substrate-binding protein
MNALRSSLFAAIALMTPYAAQAASLEPNQQVIKLGTVAPNGSSFHKILQKMGARWSAVPGGASLRIYPGGIAGGEADMVNKMKFGQLDAALVTANGLADIDPAVQSLQGVPMLFHSLEEVDYITGQLRPKLDQRLRQKGFVALVWLDAGWVRFFSKNPVQRPDDLRKTKVFTWAGDTHVFDIYKSAGFHPVALETNDILPMLRTGMITAVPYPPYGALATQAFTVAPNMLDLDWAPLVGALVVTERAWNRLSPAAQTEMAKIALEAGLQMKADNRAQSNASVEAMVKRGLHVYRPTADEQRDWRRLAETSYPRIRGGLVPADFFDEVQRLLATYRAGHPETIASPLKAR